MRRLLAVLAVLVLLAVAAAGVVGLRFQAFVHTPFGGPGERDVEVAAGETLAELSHALEAAGVVSDGARFYLYGRLRHADRRLKRGEYGFDGALSPEQVLAELLSGKVKLYRVTIPEGLRMDEIAELWGRAGLADPQALLAAMRDPKLMHKLGVPAPTAEGFLFPDTYLEPKGRRPAKLVAEMVQHFQSAWAKVRALPGGDPKLDELQAVTLASIVEKETGRAEERPRISCVFHNRLRIGMRLQTDPTVIYAVWLAQGHFDGNLTKKMLLTPHPYNTYTTAGLPPGPIASPGAAALEAALHPSQCQDLYFVAKGDGTHAFCPTLVCHNANVKRFQLDPYLKARARR